jgi:hypothetical protein
MERSDRAVEVDIALALGLDPKFGGTATGWFDGGLRYRFTQGTPLSEAVAEWPDAKWSGMTPAREITYGFILGVIGIVGPVVLGLVL